MWGRYPAALALVAVLAVLITQTGDLRAISAASSAGFLLVFAMVNFANVRLATATGSRRWLSGLAALLCLAALATMLAQMAQSSSGRGQLRLVVGLLALPFAYQLVFRWRLRPRPERRGRPSALRRALVKAALLIGTYLLVAYLALPWAWWAAERGQHPALEALPTRTANADGIPGDPINVGLVGTKDQLIAAMLAAGWYPADPITLRSSLDIAASVVLDRPDPDAPVSPLYLFGRKQDLAFEQEVGRSADRRHHVRWWLTDRDRGRPAVLAGRGQLRPRQRRQPPHRPDHPPYRPRRRRAARPADGGSRGGGNADRPVPAPGRRPDAGRPQCRRRSVLHGRDDRCRRAARGRSPAALRLRALETLAGDPGWPMQAEFQLRTARPYS